MALANQKCDLPVVGDVLSAISWKNEHIGILHFKSGKDVSFCIRHPDIVQQAVASSGREVKTTSDAKEFFRHEEMPHQCREKYEEKVAIPERDVGHEASAVGEGLVRTSDHPTD